MSESGWQGRDDPTAGQVAWRDVAIGVGIVLLEHLFVGGLLAGVTVVGTKTALIHAPSVGMFAVYWLFGIGLSQLGYVVPTFLVALIVRRNVAAGVAIAALVTFLLNGVCFGFLYTGYQL